MLFTTYQLMLFLNYALSEFNQTPPFTNFTFEDTEFINTFGDLIVKGAEISALAAEELIERGKEFTTIDLGFQPPSISDVLDTKYGTDFTNWGTEIKSLKALQYFGIKETEK